MNSKVKFDIEEDTDGDQAKIFLKKIMGFFSWHLT